MNKNMMRLNEDIQLTSFIEETGINSYITCDETENATLYQHEACFKRYANW